MGTFVPFGRDQSFLLPPDLNDWLPEDDLAHFIVAAVEWGPLSAFPAKTAAPPASAEFGGRRSGGSG